MCATQLHRALLQGGGLRREPQTSMLPLVEAVIASTMQRRSDEWHCQFANNVFGGCIRVGVILSLRLPFIAAAVPPCQRLLEPSTTCCYCLQFDLQRAIVRSPSHTGTLGDRAKEEQEEQQQQQEQQQQEEQQQEEEEEEQAVDTVWRRLYFDWSKMSRCQLQLQLLRFLQVGMPCSAKRIICALLQYDRGMHH